jgi:hypothetical protein
MHASINVLFFVPLIGLIHSTASSASSVLLMGFAKTQSLSFAVGVYCQGCNCLECSNTPERSDVVLHERNRVLQREPMAFSAKVDAAESPEAYFQMSWTSAFGGVPLSCCRPMCSSCFIVLLSFQSYSSVLLFDCAALVPYCPCVTAGGWCQQLQRLQVSQVALCQKIL